MRSSARLVVLVVAVASLGVIPAATLGDPSEPVVEQRKQPVAAPTAESEYNRGIRARVAKDWPTAVDAFHKAISLRAAFPEAWNELGYALRNQGRYAESVNAYGEALRLRPKFPEALEYLGEAYVKLGRLDEARRVLDRLRPLDAGRARELAEVIQKGK